MDGNKAKFNEYSDIGNSLYGRIRLLYDSDSYFLGLNAADMGYGTQSYKLSGAAWDRIRFDLSYRETPHNTTFGARTPFSGAGTGNLTLSPSFSSSDRPSTWQNRFDYSTKRKLLGGDISLSLINPFFLTITASTEKKEGIKPAGVSLSTSEDISLELPEPIDYTTNNLGFTAGYAKKPLFLSVGLMYTELTNSNERLNFTNFDPSAGSSSRVADTLTLPPDNSHYKSFLKGGVSLPYNSKFSVNLGRSVAKSKAALLSSVYQGGGSPTPLILTDSTFNGKIVSTNADMVLTTSPLRFLDGKVFTKYYNRDNQSDTIDSSGIENRIFDYRKTSYGGELGFRLPAKLYLTAGYSLVDTKRDYINSQDLFTGQNPTNADTKDNICTVDLKWRGNELMSAKVGYERLSRDSDFRESGAPSTDLSITKNFDLAAKVRNYYKASVELFPVDYVTVGLGYKYKETVYQEFGLKTDRRNEFIATADYSVAKLVRIFAYGDYEDVASKQVESNQGAKWHLKQKGRNYDLGVGADVFILPQTLTLKLQYDYARSQGNADFEMKPSPETITNWDSYKRITYMAKLIYDVSTTISVATGYAYEKFTYSDAELDGYTLTPDNAYLTGAYRDQSYSANLVFANLTYRFR
ncbi:MAG: MtrB/PioB family outer membrane beta-barrel protein [Nitrospirales bacterium]|nr:MtrB/PioB family outer membrane beta-barrel protein [Nitrospirales bacterium]